MSQAERQQRHREATRCHMARKRNRAKLIRLLDEHAAKVWPDAIPLPGES